MKNCPHQLLLFYPRRAHEANKLKKKKKNPSEWTDWTLTRRPASYGRKIKIENWGGGNTMKASVRTCYWNTRAWTDWTPTRRSNSFGYNSTSTISFKLHGGGDVRERFMRQQSNHPSPLDFPAAGSYRPRHEGGAFIYFILFYRRRQGDERTFRWFQNQIRAYVKNVFSLN